MKETAIQLELHGDVDSAYGLVAEVFLEGFSEDRDVGAALAVFRDGEPVVDVHAGYRDRQKTDPWTQDTLCCLFSATKGVTTLCVLQAVREGLLDLDEPVSACWPEFGRHGKSAITLRHVLSHRAGLVGFHAPVEPDLFYDWTAICTALADERTWWAPGEKHGYHARTFGYLLGEVLRRRTGLTVSGWLEQKLVPRYELDLHIGLTESDLSRCAQMLPARVKAGALIPEQARLMMERFNDISTPTGAAFQNPSFGAGYMNSTRFRMAEMPAMNGHGTARSMAALYSRVPEILGAELLEEATTTQSIGPDEVLMTFSHFGLGFMLYHELAPIGCRPGTYGHAGAGGSMAFHDPVNGIGFCFVMNQMQQGVVTGGTSASACARAVYECIQ